MSVLSAGDRKEMPRGEFAGPGRTFPVNDKTHQREAISGATRSEHAGNISESEADSIKAKARAKLGDKDGQAPVDHKAAVAKMHPQHVHDLVKRAHAGEFGPEAQKSAQQAMQAAPGQQGEQQTEQPAQPNYAGMFGGGAAQDEDDTDQAVPAGQMFGGR